MYQMAAPMQIIKKRKITRGMDALYEKMENEKQKTPLGRFLFLENNMVGTLGIEPRTITLKGCCSTD
jgi:hypothetical protein